LTVHDPVGLSQFKWMLVGIFSFVFVGVGGWLVSSYFFPGSMANGNWLLTVIGWFLLPVCLAIAILRYRLFDIDIIIRRTLIYGSLSLMLATVYFGSVLVLQNLFQSITGIVQSPLAIVLTTLFIAAIFQPLRSKIQNDIDKRFYRRRYDAAKAIEHFAATARQETNLELLRDELLIVVTETMQPESVSLWLVSSPSPNIPVSDWSVK
jgi:hypothetical protein